MGGTYFVLDQSIDLDFHIDSLLKTKSSSVEMTLGIFSWLRLQVGQSYLLSYACSTEDNV